MIISMEIVWGNKVSMGEVYIVSRGLTCPHLKSIMIRQ